jgi:hypothetical protein
VNEQNLYKSFLFVIYWTGLVATTACFNQNINNNQMPEKPIEEVLKAHTPNLMSIPGVVGTAQGLWKGQPCIQVFVSELTKELKKQIPKTLEGYQVDIQETGSINTFPKN